MNRSVALFCLALFAAGPAAGETLIVCGDRQVFTLDVEQAAGGQIVKTWTWSASDSGGLPEELARLFRTTDDCKPVEGGSKILVSSSSGGCALVERPGGKVLWHARVPNAHSLEPLPGGWIVAAASLHAAGNRLMLFRLDRPDHLLGEVPLVSAHGVVWDRRLKRLWALGLKTLECHELKDADGKPALAMAASYPLPDEDGHDLQAVPHSSELVVTTGRHVYLFDRQRREFRPHPTLADKGRVKSVAIHPASGRLAYTQAGEKEWWTDTIQLLAPAATIRLPGERLYKVRWLAAEADQPGAAAPPR